MHEPITNVDASNAYEEEEERTTGACNHIVSLRIKTALPNEGWKALPVR